MYIQDMKLEWKSLHMTNKICWICNAYVAYMAFSSANVLSCCVKETLFWSGMRSSTHLLCCLSQAVVFALIHTSSVSIPHPISLFFAGWLTLHWALTNATQTELTISASIKTELWRIQGPTKAPGYLIHPVCEYHWESKPLGRADGSCSC